MGPEIAPNRGQNSALGPRRTPGERDRRSLEASKTIGRIFDRASRVLVIAALFVRPALWVFITTNRITA